MRKITSRILPLAAAALMVSCIPYRVGSTAHTVEVGETEITTSVSFIPAGEEFATGDESATDPAFSMLGAEVRYGLDDQSDVGLRMVGFTGIVVSYKRRFLGENEGPALAYMAGAGLVNLANHAHFEFSLIASGSEWSTVTPYGGLRAMQVLPLNDKAVSDDPSIGAFAGVRIGSVDMGVSPEIGFFYDPSALDLRETDYIFFPSVTVHGNFMEAIF